ncbi:oxidoreductase [Streptomyces sp. F-3]|uniref:Uncharacterized protein n=1 Tax=Streptomyces thermogriseus TaxID=75292 RepID=A0ABN1STB8_9ACTN|nr:oxidoreductase [Streptomyces sp. F-3]
MTRRTVRIAVNGVIGRRGCRRHLVRSVHALREQGGLDLGDGTVLWPEPALDGRGRGGDGAIGLRQRRSRVEAAGYRGAIEVEPFNEELWARDGRGCRPRPPPGPWST